MATSATSLFLNNGLIQISGIDTILFDYIVNYIFPQYALPWNNFYTKIDQEPYNLRNEQRNQNAVLARVPISVDAKPNLVITSGSSLPIWSKTVNLSHSNTGLVLDSAATKTLLGKIYYKDKFGFDYQYSYSGAFAGVDGISSDSEWLVFQLNLLNISPKNKQAVLVVTEPNHSTESSSTSNKVYSTLIGSIVINQSTKIDILNPIPLGATPDPKIQEIISSGESNTVYTLFGNRIFIAIKTDDQSISKSHVSYNFQFRIIETPTIASALNQAVLP